MTNPEQHCADEIIIFQRPNADQFGDYYEWFD